MIRQGIDVINDLRINNAVLENTVDFLKQNNEDLKERLNKANIIENDLRKYIVVLEKENVSLKLDLVNLF